MGNASLRFGCVPAPIICLSRSTMRYRAGFLPIPRHGFDKEAGVKLEIPVKESQRRQSAWKSGSANTTPAAPKSALPAERQREGGQGKLGAFSRLKFEILEATSDVQSDLFRRSSGKSADFMQQKRVDCVASIL
jgi:hypothetical protein